MIGFEPVLTAFFKSNSLSTIFFLKSGPISGRTF